MSDSMRTRVARLERHRRDRQRQEPTEFFAVFLAAVADPDSLSPADRQQLQAITDVSPPPRTEGSMTRLIGHETFIEQNIDDPTEIVETQEDDPRRRGMMTVWLFPTGASIALGREGISDERPPPTDPYELLERQRLYWAERLAAVINQFDSIKQGIDRLIRIGHQLQPDDVDRDLDELRSLKQLAGVYRSKIRSIDRDIAALPESITRSAQQKARDDAVHKQELADVAYSARVQEQLAAIQLIDPPKLEGKPR